MSPLQPTHLATNTQTRGSMNLILTDGKNSRTSDLRRELMASPPLRIKMSQFLQQLAHKATNPREAFIPHKFRVPVDLVFARS